MEDLFESIIWLIVIAFWIISGLLKKRAKQPPEAKRQPYPQPPYHEKRAEFEEKILEALGFPAPKPIPPQAPKVKKKPEATSVITGKKLEVKTKAPPAPAPVKAEEEVFPAPLVFTPEKLQEGIILSTILGPPKSIELRDKTQRLRQFLALKS